MNRNSLLALFTAVILLATACGAGSDTGTAASVAGSSGSDSTADPADAGSSSADSNEANGSDDSGSASSPAGGSADAEGTAMAADSPIGAFFADDGGFEAAIAEYQVRVGEAITRCMAAQGFEFAAGGDFNDNPVQDAQNELTIREWTSEFGFGISTSFDSVAQNQASDPNTAIFLGMSESEREIWAATLTGGDLGDLGGGFGSRPLEEQGCIGQALIETGGQDAIEGLETFGSAYEEGEEALFERREMVDATTAWTRCMSEAGYPNYAGLDDPEDEISEKFDVVTAPLQAALDSLSDEEGQALISGESLDIADLPDLDVTALRNLQEEEITLALADLDCYEAEVQAIFEPLRNDFENGLLNEYSTEFDALRNIGG